MTLFFLWLWGLILVIYSIGIQIRSSYFFVWPEFLTLLSAVLLQVARRYNQRDILLHYHAPQVLDCVGQWALTRDKVLITASVCTLFRL